MTPYNATQRHENDYDGLSSKKVVSDTVSRGESYVVAAVGTLLSKQREPGAQGMKGACWKQRRKERSC